MFVPVVFQAIASQSPEPVSSTTFGFVYTSEQSPELTFDVMRWSVLNAIAFNVLIFTDIIPNERAISPPFGEPPAHNVYQEWITERRTLSKTYGTIHVSGVDLQLLIIANFDRLILPSVSFTSRSHEAALTLLPDSSE